jgi:PAS domain S-box-containing protein
MASGREEKLNQSIEQILRLNLELVKPGTRVTGKIADDEVQLDAILNGLNALGAELQAKSQFVEYRSVRLNEMVEALLKYTLLDFSQQLPISENGDELDAIALGLNTLGEELKSHIELLRESEENLRMLIEGVKDYAIIMLDAEGYVRSWNSGAERIKGYKAGEIIGKHFSVFYTDEEIERNEPAFNLSMAREKGNHESEGWRLRKDGSQFWSDAVLTALYDGHGNVKGFSKITKDITQKKQYELDILEKSEELLRSNKQLEQFVYIASHDLQEPLKTLSNYVGLFQEDYHDKLDKNSSKYLDFINTATDRMRMLVQDLLEYARVGQQRNVAAIDCNLLLIDVLKDMDGSIAENKAKIQIEPLPVIHGNYSELKSLFQNLLSNAIKFRRQDEPLVVRITAKESGNEWIFAVQDNGIGIENEYHERIFSIFQKLHSQKKYPGTGIGLAHCKKIVEIHRGKMWVESVPGKGSTFYFTIPKTTSK